MRRREGPELQAKRDLIPSGARRIAVALAFLAACAPEPKTPTKPTATLFFSNVELAPGRTFPSPLVRGRVNGKETTFIVDTGAQVSVVDVKLAQAAAVVVTAGGSVQDPSGEGVPSSKTDAPNFVVDGLGSIPNRWTAVIALPEVLTNLGIGAILSPQNILDPKGGHQLVLDLANRELRFDDPSAASKVSSSVFDLGPIQVCHYGDESFSAAALIAHAVIDGVPTQIELDTGASNTFIVTDSDAGRKLAERTDGERKRAVSPAGEFESARFSNIPAVIGEFDASGPLMTMPGKRSHTCGYEGRIGIDRLRTCTLVISQNDARATCSKPSD